jgi:tRNA-Thr(GGU) m(6)t(6)A37 methyltransferase TsaA
MNLRPIGIIQTCFPEKFGIPRQSLMIPDAWGVVRLDAEFSDPNAVLHLQEFSHIWILYEFHQAPTEWSPLIIPPRIDAPNKVGVFASRSPRRPNPIGMSVVKLNQVNRNQKGQTELFVSGVDILDGSPVYDIKPYIPYSDQVTTANAGWIKNEIEKFDVEFSETAKEELQHAQQRYNTESKSGKYPACDLRTLITQTLEWDPRPRSQREVARIQDPSIQRKNYAFRILDLDVHWEITPDQKIVVIGIKH